jgi:vitamin K-dependent gamma-carboxylase
MAGNQSFLTRLQLRAFAPVDIASLVFFRIAFGLLMTWEVSRYFQHHWISRYWIEPEFLFKYYGFFWVQPWPGQGMYIHWLVLGLLALFIAAGFLYRLSAALFFLGFAYGFLLDQATYLNHFYLVCLLSFLLIFVPAHRAVSVDAWFSPRIRSNVAPAWTLWLLRAQMAIVYLFGGIAKLSPDWLHGEPMRSWMAARSDFPLIGRYFTEEWAVYAASYGSLLLDLFIAPALLWRRTRLLAFGTAVLFHLSNARLFSIGVFPWLGIAATTLFLSPSWPRKLLSIFRPKPKSSSVADAELPFPRHPRLILSLVSIYLIVQVLVPLRHLLYPGRVDWTYEGHRFSWRMKLIDRDARAQFYVINPNDGETLEVDPRSILAEHQVLKMASRPDMILQFAHFLAKKTAFYGTKPLRVEARVLVSLNGRKPQLLLDQNVDLAAQPRTLKHVSWLLPMTAPLPARPASKASGDESESASE